GDGEFLLGRHAVELQPARAYGLDILRPHVDQRHVLAVMRQVAADVPAQCACPDECYALAHLSSSGSKTPHPKSHNPNPTIQIPKSKSPICVYPRLMNKASINARASLCEPFYNAS